jgi:predicted phage terminase large subunit-like protein
MSQATAEFEGLIVNDEYIPHTPTAKQAAFLLSRKLEILYGGAAGGGKSDALLMAALQYAHVPGYNAILFRRTFADLSLPEALIPRSKEWMGGTSAKWRHPSWTFPSGATLTFAYLEYDKHVYKYQSAAFQFIGFDELTQFTEWQFRYMFSRLRRLEGMLVPLRMRGATNPGGVGHEWVKQRFLKQLHSDRLFIPARLEDNPYLDRDAYIKSLMHLDPVTRAQLLSGDWDAVTEGAKFNREWFDRNFIEQRPKRLRLVRYWDLAATPKQPTTDPDWTVGLLLGMDPSGLVYVCNVRRFRLSEARTEAIVKRTAKEDGIRVPIYIEQEPGSAGKMLIGNWRRKVLQGYSVHGDPPTGSKVERANPISSRAEQGEVYIVNDGSWNVGAFMDELVGFPFVAHDDQVDALTGAYKSLAGATVPESLGSTDAGDDWDF